MSALDKFRLIAPEFSTVADATVNSFLEMAPSFIDADQYADPDLATALQAASLMLVQKNSSLGQSSGSVLMSEKEGDLSRSYGQASSKSEILDIYADMLLKLGRKTGVGTAGASITRMADWVPSL